MATHFRKVIGAVPSYGEDRAVLLAQEEKEPHSYTPPQIAKHMPKIAKKPGKRLRFNLRNPLAKKAGSKNKVGGRRTAPEELCSRLLDSSVDNAIHFFDTLEGCLTAALDDQTDLCDAFRVSAVATAVAEASIEVEPHPAALQLKLSPGKRYGYAVIVGAIKDITSKNTADPFEGFLNELPQFYKRQREILAELVAQQAVLRKETKKASAKQFALWGFLGLTLCGVAVLTFIAPPVGVPLGSIAIAAMTQGRMALHDLLEKHKGNLKEMRKAVNGYLIEAEQDLEADLSKYKEFVAKDFQNVRKLAKDVGRNAKSVMKQKVGYLEPTTVDRQIGEFRREQRRFMRKLRVLIKQVRESRKRIREEAKAVYKARI